MCHFTQEAKSLLLTQTLLLSEAQNIGWNRKSESELIFLVSSVKRRMEPLNTSWSSQVVDNIYGNQILRSNKLQITYSSYIFKLTSIFKFVLMPLIKPFIRAHWEILRTMEESAFYILYSIYTSIIHYTTSDKNEVLI